MRTEPHIFQSNGDKQRGFGCLAREKKKEWEKPEVKSLQRRLFSEKCQRSCYPICAEWAEQSKPLAPSLTLSHSMHVNIHSLYLLCDTDWNHCRSKKAKSRLTCSPSIKCPVTKSSLTPLLADGRLDTHSWHTHTHKHAHTLVKLLDLLCKPHTEQTKLTPK